ncbi:MAG TPA: 2-oxoacid:acceptor oxidoreductase family protein [Spirochaetales bacterium]|mgnify:CR=1|nr:2-oxoacid:acceptor oxidoreductase family protein [Spirochaetales bacterium]HPD80435.1 2-oxoacid:acceptor oxidoreductase family protein [Spirochaetales bacterium]HQG40948.1 2-oxoacid:acceptor oxidoreductase family protein [Spirochaetales bacterium]HQK34576.1 2-oxoacid:acceptor oxidoreductase family protein [Spirochaetales bacterium]HRV28679.1 2-oxoacid:acceptor oxidoreductase family protein [Spirochaetia bacterium]
MTEKTFMAGFGGQGIISLGQLWVYCGMKEGLNVTFFPYYGAEKRGGIARANVIVSDKEIASPLVTKPDSAIVMNMDSLPICEEIVKPNGTLLINSSLVKVDPNRKDVKVVKVPCNELAEEIGDVKIANMVMMGALSKVTGAVKLAKLEEVLKSFFPENKHKYIPMNIKAIEAGMNAVK